MSDHAPLPDTVAELHALVLEQQASIEEQQASFEKMVQELAARDQEIECLKALIDKLKSMHFGRKPEQLDHQIENLETQLEELTAGRGAVDVQHAKTGKDKPASSKEPDPVCPKCGAEMQMLGKDVSEQLASVAAAFKVIRTIRRKMLCPSCGHIEQPPMPGLPIERSIAHPSALADIVVSKFADHQPLYRRQAEIATRDGVTLDRASMGCWSGQIAELCRTADRSDPALHVASRQIAH
ncbi:MAG: IS66 family transposase zinc-finger binding domain-containing protein [Burkholderia sp.]